MLEQRRVAGHEARREEPNDLPERVIPRHDREHDTERLERDDALTRVRLHSLIGEEARRVIGVEVAIPRALLDLGEGLGDRLAHLRRDQARVAILAVAKHARQPPDRDRPLGDRDLAPCTECRVGCRDGGFDVGLRRGIEARPDDFSRGFE